MSHKEAVSFNRMVNPVSSAYRNQARQVEQPPPQKPQPKPKSVDVEDKVTLKSAGDVDHDGDRR